MSRVWQTPRVRRLGEPFKELLRGLLQESFSLLPVFGVQQRKRRLLRRCFLRTARAAVVSRGYVSVSFASFPAEAERFRSGFDDVSPIRYSSNSALHSREFGKTVVHLSSIL